MTSSTTTSRAWLIRALTLALVIVLAIALYVAIASYRDIRATDRVDSDRRAVTVAAQEFALRMDNFQAASADKYEGDIQDMLTTKGQAQLKQVAAVLKQVYLAAQPQASAGSTKKGSKKRSAKKAKPGPVGRAPSGTIVYTGVAELDDDSATVLVAHDTSVTNSNKHLHFRWTVNLKKIDGKWLVDGLPPEVTGGSKQ